MFHVRLYSRRVQWFVVSKVLQIKRVILEVGLFHKPQF